MSKPTKVKPPKAKPRSGAKKTATMDMSDWDVISTAEANEAAAAVGPAGKPKTKLGAKKAAEEAAKKAAAGEEAVEAAVSGGVSSMLGGIMGGLGQFTLMSVFFSPPVMQALGDFVKPAAGLIMKPWSPFYWASEAVAGLGNALDDFFNPKPIKVIRVSRKKKRTADVRIYAAANQWKNEKMEDDRYTDHLKEFKTQKEANEAWLTKFISSGRTVDDLEIFMEPNYFIYEEIAKENILVEKIQLRHTAKAVTFDTYKSEKGIISKKKEVKVEKVEQPKKSIISDDELDKLLGDDDYFNDFLEGDS